ncbi:Shedu immune nuclease family protein [Burkholderia vietnamiensis]|uniref:Shedu immune nuclease family protein n=1 Tax=Burkholderia vietnamiensis TaxID=60552 RepID=UPI001B942709|nr:Shedu immune nuclease family protein [Burkholderia vietnamiensis]MBR8010442.1 DUF4263 domain-containing protein [Burkholderia vietnamiensis]
MTKPAVVFESVGDQLHLIYRPRDDSEWVRHKFRQGDELVIKGTFHLTREKLVVDDVDAIDVDNARELDPEELEFEDEMAFIVATAEGAYFRFDPDVLPVGVPVLLFKQARPTWKWFSAERKVSILAIVANLKPSRIVIGGSEPDAIPLADYERLIEQFPTPHELKRYVQARTAAVVRQYTDAIVDAEAMLNSYVNKRLQTKSKDIVEPFREADIAKYKFLLKRLKQMLDSEDGYSESTWQKEILQIVRLLNPKYIAAFTEVPVWDSDSSKWRHLDMLLVDASGNVDVIEIKKPFDKCIVTAAVYRDNHIPLRELSGSVMQIEKYLRHLNRWGSEGEVALRKHFGNALPHDFQIKITNPSGIVIMGRDAGLSSAQQRDFEVTRRHYKHIADIVTYDDLLRRLETVLNQLKADA